MPSSSSLREGLVGVVDELREVAHGIHPAILTEGGLRPALATLARRSPVPVDLDVRGGERLPDAMEVGLYYVASEALTNVIKHARATHVVVDLQLDPTVARFRSATTGWGARTRGPAPGWSGWPTASMPWAARSRSEVPQARAPGSMPTSHSRRGEHAVSRHHPGDLRH